MTLDERIKLGEPVMALVGSCHAAEALTTESDLKAFSQLLIRRADELLNMWNEITLQGSE